MSSNCCVLNINLKMRPNLLASKLSATLLLFKNLVLVIFEKFLYRNLFVIYVFYFIYDPDNNVPVCLSNLSFNCYIFMFS